MEAHNLDGDCNFWERISDIYPFQWTEQYVALDHTYRASCGLTHLHILKVFLFFKKLNAHIIVNFILMEERLIRDVY